jgi:2-dehydropantoate 2-reductase
MTRIAIIGAGAIGSVLGGLLCRDGHEVTLIARSEHVHAIRQDGLKVDGALGAFMVQPAAAESLDFKPDFAFLTVKTQDVLAAVQTNRSFLDNAPLVTFQNGVRSDETVASLIPRGQIISAVVNTSASYLTPGTVTIVYPGSIVVGRPFSDPDELLKMIADLLGAVISTKVSNNIPGAHWLKLIVNLNNAFPAITDMTYTQVYRDPYMCQLAVRVMREGLDAVKKAGIRLEPLPDVPLLLTQLMAKLPIRLAASLLRFSASRRESEWPLLGSTLQSLRRGRPTEIDYLNGEVVRLGQETNTPTPLNAAIVDIVRQIERSGQFWRVEQVKEWIEGRNKDL